MGEHLNGWQLLQRELELANGGSVGGRGPLGLGTNTSASGRILRRIGALLDQSYYVRHPVLVDQPVAISANPLRLTTADIFDHYDQLLTLFVA